MVKRKISNNIILYKIITVFIFLNSSISCYSQEKVVSDSILWQHDRPLKWSDFKGYPEKSPYNTIARTYSNIRIIDRYLDGRIPKYRIGSYFFTKKSWTTVKDSITLKHEQVHFDISELYARKIRKIFDSLNNNLIEDYRIYVEEASKLINKANEVNSQYDSEVYFNEIKQKEWIDSIAKELDSLKDYRYRAVNK